MSSALQTESAARPSTSFIPFSAPWIGDEEVAELVGAVRSGWLTAGPLTRRFEQAFREYVGAGCAVAASSCTAALHLALRALEVGEGDAVLTSPFTFAATANVAVHCGAEVVFADISPHTYNLDPGAVEEALARHRGRPVRVLIAVHYAGQSCDMDGLEELARRHGLIVVEDAAHAAGTRYRGRSAGTLGRAGCFSFYPTKNLTTGEGGMLTTDDEALAHRARRLSQHGISRDSFERYSEQGTWRYDVVEAGFKYNLTDLGAALGLHQLRRLDGFVARRRELAARYTRAFAGRGDLVLPLDTAESFHSRHLYPVEIASDRVGRDRFIEELKRRGIGASVHFLPLHLTGFYRSRFGFRTGQFPVAERVFERIVSLPLYPALTDDQADRVIEAVCGILDGRESS